MAKGVSAAQNIFALCTMYRHGIHSFYNIIFGFPFETPDHYRAMIKLLPSLYHLAPPVVVVPVLVTRHAPLANDPERFGAKGPLKAHWRYELVFSPAFLRQHNLAPEDFCYYFDSPYRDFSPELKTLYDTLQLQVVEWSVRFAAGKARLLYEESGEGLVVRDTRFGEAARVYRWGRAHRVLGQLLRRGVLPEAKLLLQAAQAGVAEAEARAALAELLQARVVLCPDNADLVWVALDQESVRDHPSSAESFRLNERVRESSEWEDWDDAPAMSPARPAGRLVPLATAD
jgi:hypothetical protein